MISFKKLHPLAQIPHRATPLSAGLDLCSVEHVILPPGQRRLVHTGLSMKFGAPWYEGQIRPRSGLALKQGVTVLNAPGTIDNDYRGEICVILVNFGTETFYADPGDRIAQMVVAKVEYPGVVEVTDLDDTERGIGGFGSTGA